MDLRRSTGVQIGDHNTQHITYQPPPQPAPVALRNTLPRDIAAFTGRDGELHRLLHAAENSSAPVLTIHAVDGMPGVGKTALVTHAAHQLASRYPDGQLFVDLHAHTAGQPVADPADVLATLLISIGISPQHLPDTLEERAALWRDRLADRRVLLVLDNAADPDQVEPLLPASEQCLVLVTSRRRLIALDGAHPLALNTLPPEESARLFTRLARREPTGTGLSAVAEAVRLCGHLPLAITLLAARLSHHPTWELATFTDEFASARDRLSELEAGPRAVAAAFDLSYNDLPPHLQRFFRHLGLHPGPDIDPYATAALTHTPLTQARRHLDTLYADHLIEEPTPRRYRFHDLLRQYAHTLTTHDPTTTRIQATHRLLTYYTHTAQTADHHLNTTPRPHTHPTPGPDAAPDLATREQALAWMRTECHNLIACAHHTHPTPGPDAAPDLATREQALAWMRTECHNPLIACAHHAQPTHLIALADAMAAYLRQQGPWDQAATLHQAAATTAHKTNNRLGEAHALQALGRVRRMMGEYAEAAKLSDQALDLYRTLGHRPGEADALQALGRVRRTMGEYAEAAKLSEQALDLYRTLGHRPGEADALQALGRVRWATGERAEAAKLSEQALSLYRTLGHRPGEANTLQDLGIVGRMTGEFRKAAKLSEEALGLYRTLGDRLGEANTLQDLGIVRRMMGEYAEAAKLSEQALSLYRTLGNPLGEANTLKALGRVRRMMGEYAEAAKLGEQALDLYRTLGHRPGEANTLKALGIVRRMMGEYAEAAKLSEQALDLYRTLGDRSGEAHTLQDLGELRSQMGNVTEGMELAAQSLDLFRKIGDRQGEAKALYIAGDLLAESGQPQQALASYEEALLLARQVRSPLEEAHALEGTARCQARADAQAAIISLREAVAIYQRIGAAETPTATEDLTRLEAEQG
ncbi:tetratricopeptide repeat protein [Streptomyces noursei]|uniref:tetratricopeptide repeat protein n=1 Tax=Streptomyces noursei TaxID=1971 RepID=UPI003806E14B